MPPAILLTSGNLVILKSNCDGIRIDPQTEHVIGVAFSLSWARLAAVGAEKSRIFAVEAERAGHSFA